MGVMAWREPLPVRHGEESERSRGRRRGVSAVKLRAVALASFGVWLFVLAFHVITAGWETPGGPLYTALSALSGLTFLRPTLLLTLLQRWGG